MTLYDMATFRSYPHNPTGSQESLGSYSSGTAVATSSTASQATADTDLTVPTSPQLKMPDASSQQTHATQSLQQSSTQIHNRLHTPENQIDASARRPSAQTSPMSIATPATGHKRMASGEVKSLDANTYRSPAYASRAGLTRTGSVGSVGSKASEVCDRHSLVREDNTLTEYIGRRNAQRKTYLCHDQSPARLGAPQH